MVLVWMTTDVSAFCQYSDLVVMVLVTLQDVAQSATTANAVNKIICFISAPFVFEIRCKGNVKKRSHQESGLVEYRNPMIF